ncbi:hypothetical protein [Lactococcus lactis]
MGSLVNSLVKQTNKNFR